MIKVKRAPEAPRSLTEEKAKKNGTYNQEDVKRQLYLDFSEKCYLCEAKELQDGGEIEHLIAHKGDIDLKFDWKNLFLCCGHCNSIKNRPRYEKGILDCTEVDPEEKLEHIYEEEGDQVRIVAKEKNKSVELTAELLMNIFNASNTITRTKAAEYRVKGIKIEMNKLYRLLYEYQNEKSNRFVKVRIQAMIRRQSEYAAFKRHFIRQSGEKYPEFLEYMQDH